MPCAGNWPLRGTRKASMERIQRRQGMTSAPAGTVRARCHLRSVAGEQDPSFPQRHTLVMKPEGIAILTVVITGGEDYENRPGFLRIETSWHRERRHCVRRDRVAALRDVAFFQSA